MATATAAKTDRRAVEWLKASADAAYFTDTYLYIHEPQGATHTVIPFKLWPAQIKLIWLLMVTRLVVVLKARQLGISWLVCAYVLWLCFFQEGRVALFFSQGQLEADELIRRVKAMYTRLPEWMLAAGPKLTIDNTSELEWSSGSNIKSLPATKKAGRSLTASVVLMDEFAFLEWGETLYSAAKPVIDGGGQFFIVSTANGEGTLFHTLWQNAVAALNNFKAVFLPWWTRPDRTQEWYAALSRDAVTPLQIQTIRQEYPGTPDEAFISVGADRFLADITWWDGCKENLPPLGNREAMVLGVDAGVSDDNFALVGVTRHPARREDVAIRYVRRWTAVNGKIDFDNVEAEIERLCREFYVVQVAYDPYQLHQMMTRLEKRGVPVYEFGQGALRLESDKGLQDLIMSRRISHDGNEILREHIDNSNADVDIQARKLRIVKRTQARKIDTTIATSIASHRCLKLNL